MKATTKQPTRKAAPAQATRAMLLKLPEGLIQEIDAWRKAQGDEMNRSAAIRRMCVIAIKAEKTSAMR